MRYELCDHTADALVRCGGETLEECFACAAYAMVDQMVDASAVDQRVSREIEASGADWEERLYAFLSELLFVVDCEGLVFSGFDVRFDGDRVLCTARGEALDPARHRPRSEVKAVTYHMLRVDPAAPSLTVLFDL